MQDKINELLEELRMEVKKSVDIKTADTKNLKRIAEIQTKLNRLREENK